MGQHTKSARPRPPHTGRPHGCVNLAESKHGLITRACPYQTQIESNLEKANFEGS
ncbi:hypothetical protein F383_01750 [Gossypium arboreum]|uniref:Uncharacterized protein n=1 Tax=Gossypium arboreum TaxID=29729 RepID=A0A0B0PAE9_GOSAR|nr:hypothetical protein F383_01750 [Gossypium arboreum]